MFNDHVIFIGKSANQQNSKLALTAACCSPLPRTLPILKEKLLKTRLDDSAWERSARREPLGYCSGLHVPRNAEWHVVWINFYQASKGRQKYHFSEHPTWSSHFYKPWKSLYSYVVIPFRKKLGSTLPTTQFQQCCQSYHRKDYETNCQDHWLEWLKSHDSDGLNTGSLSTEEPS